MIVTKILELLEKELPKYIHEVKSKRQENAKAFAFSSFMLKVFDVESKDLDFENQISILPYKKKKGKQLTIPQKEWNKLQSKIRIKVEHAISKIKKFRINTETFRNKLCQYDGISDIVCGIVNFKIRWKQEFIGIP